MTAGSGGLEGGGLGDGGLAWGGNWTGLGSMPGTDPREAAGIVLGECGPLIHLPELPARGIGADMVGRAGALLTDVLLDVSPRAYRVFGRPTRVSRAARDHLARDLDALEEAWEIAGGPGDSQRRAVKVQACGPLTLAALVELPNGHLVLTDRGATRDFARSLADGLTAHAAEVSRRLGLPVVVQIDESLLPDVVAGRIRGVTDLDVVRAVPEPEAAELLAEVTAGVPCPVLLHSCAGGLPWTALRGAGAAALSVDPAVLGTAADLDGFGETVGAGTPIALGAVPAVGSVSDRSGDRVRESARELATRVVRLFDTLGLSRGVVASSVAITPACGMAGASSDWPAYALELCRRTAGILARDAGDL